MASGLARQLGFCKINNSASVDINPTQNPAPSWCANSTFVQSLGDAQSRLWTSIKGGINGMSKLFTSRDILQKKALSSWNLINKTGPNFFCYARLSLKCTQTDNYSLKLLQNYLRKYGHIPTLMPQTPSL